MKLSIVVPVFNEQQSLSELCDRIAATAAAQCYDYEVVFVDDGSRDASWSTIVQLCQQNPAIRGVKLRRNFGKAAALSAGFERVTGDYVVTMDADLQDDPKEVPNLLGELNKALMLSRVGKRRGMILGIKCCPAACSIA